MLGWGWIYIWEDVFNSMGPRLPIIIIESEIDFAGDVFLLSLTVILSVLLSDNGIRLVFPCHVLYCLFQMLLLREPFILSTTIGLPSFSVTYCRVIVVRRCIYATVFGTTIMWLVDDVTHGVCWCSSPLGFYSIYINITVSSVREQPHPICDRVILINHEEILIATDDLSCCRRVDR